MVAYKNKLTIYGGYGYPSDHTPPRAEFIQDTRYNGRGWTNEMHTYDLEKGEEVCGGIRNSDGMYRAVVSGPVQWAWHFYSD